MNNPPHVFYKNDDRDVEFDSFDDSKDDEHNVDDLGRCLILCDAGRYFLWNSTTWHPDKPAHVAVSLPYVTISLEANVVSLRQVVR